MKKFSSLFAVQTKNIVTLCSININKGVLIAVHKIEIIKEWAH